MKVCALVIVAVVCALLPSGGEAAELRPGLHALAKRSVSVFSGQTSVDIDKRQWRTAFDKLYGELMALNEKDEEEEGDYEQAIQDVDEFLNSDDVDEFLDNLGVPMEKIDGRLYEKYPELDENEHNLVKALSLLSVANYDIDQLFADSSSEGTDE